MSNERVTIDEGWFEELLELMLHRIVEGSGCAAKGAMEMKNAPAIKDCSFSDSKYGKYGVTIRFKTGDEFVLVIIQTKRAEKSEEAE